MRPEHLGHDEDEIGRGRSLGKGSPKANAHDVRHRLVERLAEQDRLGLDAPDAEAQDAEPVDHRRVRVRSHQAYHREACASPWPVVPVGHDGGQELQVDLVDDASPRRHDAEVPEGRLGPTKELVALPVALVLAADVECECGRRPELVHLDGVVDDQVGRDERIDPTRIATQLGHRVTHHRQIHDRGHAGEVLEDHAPA